MTTKTDQPSLVRAQGQFERTHPFVQVFQLLFELFSVALPRLTIDSRRSIVLECTAALPQQVDGDVMQQRGEP
jgi:hypothetical protein